MYITNLLFQHVFTSMYKYMCNVDNLTSVNRLKHSFLQIHEDL